MSSLWAFERALANWICFADTTRRLSPLRAFARNFSSFPSSITKRNFSNPRECRPPFRRFSSFLSSLRLFGFYVFPHSTDKYPFHPQNKNGPHQTRGKVCERAEQKTNDNNENDYLSLSLEDSSAWYGPKGKKSIKKSSSGPLNHHFCSIMRSILLAHVFGDKFHRHQQWQKSSNRFSFSFSASSPLLFRMRGGTFCWKSKHSGRIHFSTLKPFQIDFVFSMTFGNVKSTPGDHVRVSKLELKTGSFLTHKKDRTDNRFTSFDSLQSWTEKKSLLAIILDVLCFTVSPSFQAKQTNSNKSEKGK